VLCHLFDVSQYLLASWSHVPAEHFMDEHWLSYAAHLEFEPHHPPTNIVESLFTQPPDWQVWLDAVSHAPVSQDLAQVASFVPHFEQ
jgi:hypothetical protein